jgi:predicted acylesterase/phospholipase RssA
MVDGHHGLVLQGGGALGAFELGVARAVYAEGSGFRPGVIAGVSIGAITAVLLGRPAKGLTPLQALEAFWERVTVSQLLPGFMQPYLALLGLPNFYTLNPWWAFGTNIYSTAPLRATLAELVDVDALADPTARPFLCFTATDIEAGELKPFLSKKGGLTLDHVLASGSLPPSFPATEIEGRSYWDGGVFDNTPLGAVIDHLEPGDAERAVMVVNLFPNRMPLPQNLADVSQHFLNLLFVNKTASDIKLMKRFNAVADAAIDLAKLAPDDPVAQLPSVKALLKASYQRVPRILEVTRTTPAEQMEASDFSHAGIERRASAGQALAQQILVAEALAAS